ncbi:MAG: glycosyltransferase family 4 protein [Bacilli bacterium]|nr:glycosyltransferase family 4 protein [Bacilli bacterium]
MKIGIDARPLVEKKTGIGTYLNEILKEINKIDKENEYYLYSNKKIVLDFELNKNFKICEHSYKIGTFFVLYKLSKILKKDNIDLFWGTEHCLPRKKEKTKYLLTIHDLALKKMPSVGKFYNVLIQNFILKKSCDNADKIIAVSKSTKKDLIELLKINDEKIKVIYPNGKQTRKYNLKESEEREIEKKYNISKNNFLFFLSTIEPRKNIITLVKAFEKLKEKNKNLKLVLSGGLGWKYKKTLKVIEKSKYKKDIILTGYINECEKEYLFKNASCFVYPSLYEGFGIPILEAMNNNQIVVTSNISSIPEVGEEAAFYYDNVLDSNSLKDTIDKVLKLTEEERKEYIKKGQAQVKKFSWEKCAKEIIDEINKM